MRTNRRSGWNRTKSSAVMARCWGTFVSAMFVFLAADSVPGQMTSNAGGATSCVDLKPGIVVEAVAKNSGAEKAGMLEGDFILSWTAGNLKGEIDSPFDLSEVEMEQGPRGQVTLTGIRGETKQTWLMGPGEWDIGTRPRLPEVLLKIYSEGQGLAKENKLAEAAQRWHTAADKAKGLQCFWLGSWLLFHGAERLARVRQWKESDILYREALDSAPQAPPEMRAILLRGWAQAFRARGDWPNALQNEKQALEESREQGPESLMIAKSLSNLGLFSYFVGDVKTAQDYQQQALTLRQKLAPGSLDVAMSLAYLADTAHEQGDLTKAENYDLQALAVEEKVAPDGAEMAGTKNALGWIESDRGDLAVAQKWISEALAIRRKLEPDSLDVASSLNNLGIVEARRGDLDKADEYWSRSLAIKEKLVPGSLDLAWTMGNLGILNLQRGDLDRAKNYLQEDLAIEAKISPDSLDTAKSLNNLGLLFSNRGDLVQAEEYYRRALAIKQRVGPDSLDVASSLSNLGRLASLRGDLSRSDDYQRRALAIREKFAPGSVETAESWNDLGSCARDRGELSLAEDDYQRAIAILEKTAPGGLQIADVQDNLGTVLAQQGDSAKAEMYYRQTLEIQSKNAPDSLEMADTLSNLARLTRERGDAVKAEDYDRLALAIEKKLAPESAGYAEALAALAGILYEKRQTDEAARLYGEAIDVLDRQLALLGGSNGVRAGFRAKRAEYYSDYADLLVSQKKPELGFNIVERSRARTSLEMLAAAHVDIRQGTDPALIEKERLLQATLTAKTNRKVDLLEGDHTPEQLASLNREIDETLSQYQELEGQIRSNSPNYAALTQPKPLSASEAQQLLDPQTALLSYALGTKRSLVFVITPEKLDVYELPKRDEIETTARRTYDLLISRNDRKEGETGAQRRARLATEDEEYRKAAMSLSQMVLGPFIEQVAGKRLLIVADGALQYIPFSALPIPTSDSSKAQVPLVAEHEIVNLPSATVLAVLRMQASQRGTLPTKEVAILADPVFDKGDPRVGKAQESVAPSSKDVAPELNSESTEHLTRSINDVDPGASHSGVALQRLAFSRREAASIMAITKPGAGMEALDFNASRETALSAQLSQYRIVHFATHGLLDSEHPELSGLVLSLVDPDGKPRNGFIDLEDVYNLSLPSDLVVLSSCETGLGKEVSGEGLVGLTRGFMYAGASRVVASLWKVDDVATSELMAEFYKGMLQSGLSPAAALRQAQLEMQKRKRWADPYYWAAFTLQGEWK
jgi:CHAT domain-containing protein/Tfp pilus assembly protein PilF